MIRFALAFVGLSLVVGCHKDEAKSDPPAPEQAAPQVAVGAGGATVQAGGAQVKANATGTTVQAGGARVQVAANNTNATAPVKRLRADDGREIAVRGDRVDMKADDGRHVAISGNTVVAEDPTRPGAKVVVGPNGVDVGSLRVPQ